MATSTHTPQVTDEQIEFFQENGYLYYGPLFSAKELDELRAEIQRFIDDQYPECYRTDLWPQEGEEPAPRGQERFLQMVSLWKHSAVVRRYAVDERRGAIIAALTRSKGIQLLSDMILYKPPGKGRSRPSIWHQDYPSNPNTLPDVTSWMPLDDVRIETGCMQYVPGSHKWGELTAPGEECRENYEKAGVDFSNVAYVQMNAGDVLFHDSRVIHYSGENTTDSPRRVYITRYMPSESRYRYREETEHLYPGWGIKEKAGQPFERENFPLVWGE